MENSFIGISQKVADSYIQSIVIVDDQAYTTKNNEGNHRAGAFPFDAAEVSSLFANAGKICAIYSPKAPEDIEKFKTALDKADVVVLDWSLDIKYPYQGDSEEDVEFDDSPGGYTVELIRDLLKDKQKLKLILIYTGEPDVNSILEKITNSLKDFNINSEDNFGDISLDRSKICVRLKEDSFPPPSPDLKRLIVNYEDLPSVILKEFTTITTGLLSNFALASISKIRENSSKVLKVFSPHLDPAYLAHKINLSNPDSSRKYLPKLFGEMISELLEEGNDWEGNWIDNWIDTHLKSLPLLSDEKENAKLTNKLKRSLHIGVNALKKEDSSFTSLLDKAGKDTNSVFAHNEGVDLEKANVDFAILTHHKNLFLPPHEAPLLTLGTVVRLDKKNQRRSSVLEGEEIEELSQQEQKSELSSQYMVCIQQRCDSVEIQDSRRFLFLPLENRPHTSNKDMCILVGEKGERLVVPTQSYALKTVFFKPIEGKRYIQATVENGSYFFYSVYGEKFEWMVEVKDMFAQRIVDRFCSQLSRVGIDESEWLRNPPKPSKKQKSSNSSKKQAASKLSNSSTTDKNSSLSSRGKNSEKNQKIEV